MQLQLSDMSIASMLSFRKSLAYRLSHSSETSPVCSSFTGLSHLASVTLMQVLNLNNQKSTELSRTLKYAH